eukprot:CAMPEP_0172754242 /NCGR_PEP_ID=MMETSP1074-20121228/157524_1 /TAXON_ID=2916 /ORGANISM="Ceratium fusus, Strain PA161109" /LENGTH=48 /DNA_ID= /DNA_START= /DNA_END= /DNA_ORIENTATION=
MTGIRMASPSCRAKNSRSLAYRATSPAYFFTFCGDAGWWARSSDKDLV